MSTQEPAAEDAALSAPDIAEEAPRGHTPCETMVRKLADIVVLPAARLSSNERSLVADIMLQILDKVDQNLRLEVAQRVARVPESPNALVRALLLDEPRVAAPIIRRIDPIPEAILIECARAGVAAHRELIARRIDLTASLADVLLEFAEADVIKLLLRREEFQFSPTAIDFLVSRSA
ncbi:MAG TPA: DUF2336 domain-containing protein, partial [Parvularculaceae bacterium]|nr:DUF2336 domain-containing protein [Parvularculaceae bacterium]